MVNFSHKETSKYSRGKGNCGGGFWDGRGHGRGRNSRLIQ